MPATSRSPVPDPGRWVKVRLPDGRPAMVTTAYDHARGRMVIVKPLRRER